MIDNNNGSGNGDLESLTNDESSSRGGSGGGGKKRGREEHGYQKGFAQDEPKDITILLKKWEDNDGYTVGFGIHNAFHLREPINHIFGRPAAGYIPFDALLNPDLNIVDLTEAEVYYDMNNANTDHTTSLANVLLLSDAERVTFHLPKAYVKGFHFVTSLGLFNVREANWEGKVIPLSVVNSPSDQKRLMVQQSFERARDYLQSYCNASQLPPYQMMGSTPVRFFLRRQTKKVPERLIGMFKQVLKCSNYVTFYAPLNPQAEEVVEDTA